MLLTPAALCFNSAGSSGEVRQRVGELDVLPALTTLTDSAALSLSRICCSCRVLGEVRQRVGELDVLPAWLRKDYGLAGWMEDLHELHNPSGSPERYQQAEKGLAMRVSHASSTLTWWNLLDGFGGAQQCRHFAHVAVSAQPHGCVTAMWLSTLEPAVLMVMIIIINALHCHKICHWDDSICGVALCLCHCCCDVAAGAHLDAAGALLGAIQVDHSTCHSTPNLIFCCCNCRSSF